MDVLMAFPGMLLAIALVAVLGPSLVNVVLALAVIGWVGYARLVRGQVLRAREFEYVTAAKALGAGTLRVLVRHVLPTAVPLLLVQATRGMAGRFLGSGAQFFGLGCAADPELGHDDQRRRVHLLDAPHLTIFPACSWRSWCSASLSSATACGRRRSPQSNLPHFSPFEKCGRFLLQWGSRRLNCSSLRLPGSDARPSSIT
jgi:hypothetical protein